jgi:hypothetical protein
MELNTQPPLHLPPAPISFVALDNFRANPKRACKRRRTQDQTKDQTITLQPPCKTRKIAQQVIIHKKLNILAAALTKNVAKGVSKVFNVQTTVKGSIAMHTGGVMYVND